MKGFTLIELLIVFAFVGILTSLGIAAYTTFNSAQSVQSSASDVATMLNTAKSRSLAQVIPASCGNNSVTGYEVDITPGGKQFTLAVVCVTKQVVTTNNLPPNVIFANGSAASVFYAISTGTVAATATIQISGYGKTKTLTINKTGNVSVN